LAQAILAQVATLALTYSIGLRKAARIEMGGSGAGKSKGKGKTVAKGSGKTSFTSVKSSISGSKPAPWVKQTTAPAAKPWSSPAASKGSRKGAVVSKGASSSKGNSKGKGKGKDKGKGKFDKGKSKGKDKGKGKGKGWGSGGDWQGGWHQQDGQAAESSRPEHVLVSTPLASMVANCVPLEAPFGNSSSSTFGMPQDRKWTRGMCRFFERGFCYHGDRCQYEHAGNPGQLALTDASSLGTGPGAGGAAVGDASSLGGSEATWWALPSTLANRACPGPRPLPDARRSNAPRLRPTFVRPARELQERMRRDGLLRRMLRPEVDGFYSTILQCVRYVVDTDFLRQERALRSVPAAIAGSGGLAPSEAPPGAVADTEDLDTADAATLAAMELDL